MAEIILSNETVQYINLASKYSGASIRDCVVEDDRVIFIVDKGHLGIAIGSKAKNLEKLRMLFKKIVKFVEFDEDKTRFIENLCKPYNITKVTFDENNGESVARIEVNPRDKSKLIGKGGRNINMIRKMAQRHHQIKDVQII
ncbi:MAG: NusA family domain protein [Thermoplasmatales archaeon]|jgi:N utilization substance protein A|nr:NusA family domain protein [Thermoplasmatales archaeon]MCU0850777.1 NusA-like transcription termination signal-binding factor [Candidatus Thermoplasmatota archaeon]